MTDPIKNRFKERLLKGEITYGLWFALGDNIAAEICAQSEFDWLMIDAEHSPITDRDVLNCLQAVAPYDICPIVRPVNENKDVIKRLCDVGVQTFLVPKIDDAKEAKSIVDAVRYPPHGIRGLGTSMARAARWNMTPDYFERANAEMCVIAQVETTDGLKNLKKIAQTDGIDAVFIGPSDLGAALGYPGQPMHEDVVRVVSQALNDIRDCGKPGGVLAVDPDLADHYIACGAQFVGVGSDTGILAKGVANLAKSFKTGGGEKGDY